MGHFEDLTGKKFGRLTAVRPTDDRIWKSVVWEFRCDCGKRHLAPGRSVRAGNTQSCGCLKQDVSKARGVFLKKISPHKLLPAGEAGFRAVLATYRKGARQRDLQFSLNEETFRQIISSACSYCGAPPSNVSVRGSGSALREDHSRYVYSGIDRRDSSKGYTLDNVVSCCATCNRIKSDISLDVLFAHLEKMLAVHNTRINSSQVGVELALASSSSLPPEETQSFPEPTSHEANQSTDEASGAHVSKTCT